MSAGVRGSKVREYVARRGVKVSPAQLDLLVPAFDAAWEAIGKRGGFLLANGETRALKDRLARVVVDLVIDGDQTDPQVIAEKAVNTVLPSAT